VLLIDPKMPFPGLLALPPCTEVAGEGHAGIRPRPAAASSG
jgi:hypothetical protein